MTIIQVFNNRLNKVDAFDSIVRELAGQAKKRGVRMVMVFPSVTLPKTQKDLETMGVRVEVISSGWGQFSFVKRILGFAVEEKATSVGFHFCDTLNFFWLFFLLRLKGIKTFYHYHGEIKPINELRFHNHHFARLRLITWPVTKIVAVSGANKKYLQALNIKKTIDVIYNGLDYESFQHLDHLPDFRQDNHIAPDVPVMITLGSLIHRKGPDVTIRAAQEVIKKVPEARFYIVGGGEKEKYQKLVDELGVGNNVILTGFVEDYPFHMLKASNIFVSGSRSESFGLCVAEAQAMGIPVVATSVGGVPEVVKDGETGFLVPTENPLELANRILHLIKNSDIRDKMGLAGRAWVKKAFGIDKQVESILNLYTNEKRV